ncbi:hypothetical protein H7J08_08015 [Mycobacterium frederiksbergense]|uniref:Uncharacterized protein n=1 Tax=Mycolicibacterium frederiksbergense TaxID=117567 RepID=A0A6H0SD12_9MYCO|nr:hypothetical protein [Mycolicibacterium frederiksbergense]QIV85258.1 hypothetical protein EXE63_11805 [Mycolicibacterium frederiksbergense]
MDPGLLSVAVTGDPKWHERTPTLLAASVAALAAIGLVVWLTMFVVRQAGGTEPAPLEYVTPFSDSSSSATITTTTGTTSPTRPVETTDISDVIGPSSSSETSSSSERPTRTPRSRANDDDDDDDETTTTRRRARQNETRTLYPRP